MTVGILQKTFTELAGDHGAVHKEDIPAIFRAAGVKVPLEVEIDIIDTAPEYRFVRHATLVR